MLLRTLLMLSLYLGLACERAPPAPSAPPAPPTTDELCVRYGGTWRMASFECVGLPMPSLAGVTVLPDAKAECARSGGTWGSHTDTCGHSCRTGFEACGDGISAGCTCPTGMCSVGATCVKVPPWHQLASQVMLGTYRDAGAPR